MFQVGPQRFEETRQKRGSHHIEMCGDRIEDANGRRVGRRAGREQRFGRCRHEAERDDLLPIARDEAPLERKGRDARLGDS